MLIKTPKMSYREFLPTGYEAYLYDGVVNMRGSATTLQSDFGPRIWTPSSLTRDTDGTIDVNDSASITISSGSFPQIAGTTDVLMVAVCNIGAATGDLYYAIGSGAGQGLSCRFSPDQATGLCPVFRDSTSGVVTVVSGRSDASLDPSVGDTVLIALAADRSAQINGYFYNLTTNEAIEDVAASGATSGTIAPQDGAANVVVRYSNLTNLYGAMTFAFTSNGLPTTWKSDVVKLARNLISAKA